MTTLYNPVLIGTTDLPMDEFPEGTIATHPDHWPVERCSCSRWESQGPDRYDSDMVGWTALVPIEADMETREHPHRVEDDPESAYLRPVPQVRYKTPWEDA